MYDTFVDSTSKRIPRGNEQYFFFVSVDFAELGKNTP